jgi:DNA-binding CsgD family transcriptional regulator
VLLGRDVERAELGGLLEAACAGRGGAVVVRGVAGSGKSTLLADVLEAATGMRVLRTSGVESESPLAFAALQRLLWPLRNRVEALPAPQRTALRAAMGEAEGEGDRYLAFLGTLSLLADAAEAAPVLAVIDDAHWLDDASTAALLFTARRIQDERVALLFAAREGDVRQFDAPDLPTIALGGVRGTAASAILSARAGSDVDPEVCDRLVEATGGNPLALGELAGALPADQLTGRVPLPTQLPLTGGVERAFLDRFHRLEEPARRLVLVGAADDTARLTVVRDAAERLGAGEAALDAAERAGLLQVDGDSVALYHPLVRSAVYRAATSAQRRAAHRALADALTGDPDRRAWHLAAAADRPDEQVVAALDGVAERAAGRGGHEAAAAAWARAAELTTGGEDRGRRLYLAASSAWLGAHPSRAAALATAASHEITAPALRVRLLSLQGQIEWNTRSLDDGYDLVLQAAQAAVGVDDAMARQLAMLTASLSAFGARSSRPFDPVARVPEPPSDAPVDMHVAFHLMHGFRALARPDHAAAAGAFRSAFALTDGRPLPGDDVLQPNLAIAAWLVDDDERSLRLHEDQLTAARRAGALSRVEHALSRGWFSQLATGSWTTAAAAAAEALSLTAGMGNAGMMTLSAVQCALVAALRGDAAADRLLVEAAQLRDEHPVGITDNQVVDLLHWGRALRATSRPAVALHHLEQIRMPLIRRMAALDLFDAAVRAGRPDVLRVWLEEVAAFADGTGTPSAIAVVGHGRAVTAGGPGAESHFEAALAAHAKSPRVPDRARTELAYGEHLRRARRRVDARGHLRSALASFEDLGATPWAERAAQELRASGETARRRDVSTATDLTAQERQVAGLVRQGLSNRDVAAQLFVSPRTVDFHLRNVFSKLGVASRAELTALPLEL